MDLFHAVEQQIGAQNIMAEDLGYMTESVKKLLQTVAFRGLSCYNLLLTAEMAEAPVIFRRIIHQTVWLMWELMTMILQSGGQLLQSQRM